MNAKNIVSIVVVLMLTAMAGADTVTYQQGAGGYSGCADNVLDANNPTYNYGRMQGDTIGDNGTRQANLLMRWTGLSIPSGQTVTGGRIKIFVEYCNCRASHNEELRTSAYEVSAANGDWEAGTGAGSAYTGKTCWDYKGFDYSNPADWAGGMNGCEGAGDHAANPESTVVAHQDNDADWHTWNISAGLIQDWLDGTNTGLLFDAVYYDEDVPSAAMDAYISCYMANSGTAAMRPILEIDYVPEPATMTLLLLGLPLALRRKR